MFSENLERICKHRETTPSAAVQAIGKGKSTASDWKRNNTVPKADELTGLADVLDCAVSDFFKEGGERYTFDVVPFDCEDVDENVADFISIYKECSNRQKVQLMNFVYDFEDKVLSAGEETC